MGQTLDLLFSAFVAKLVDHSTEASLQDPRQGLLLHPLKNELVADEQRIVTKIFNVLMELREKVLADDELFGGGDSTGQSRHPLFLKAVNNIDLIIKWVSHDTPAEARDEQEMGLVLSLN